MTYKHLVVVLALVLLYGGFIQSQEPQATDVDSARLRELWRDDFSREHREEYTTKGDVSWDQGNLRLGDGASISRDVKGGAWTRVDLTLLPSALKPGETAELRVWFLLDEAKPCFVRLASVAENPDSRSIALVTSGKTDGTQLDRTVREVPIQEEPETLSIQYRSGLVSVSADGEDRLAAYVDNSVAPVKEIRIVAARSETAFSALTFRGVLPRKELTAQEESLLQQARQADAEMALNYQRHQYAEAFKFCEKVLEIRRQVLGEEHPEYAQSLNNQALLYYSTGNYARAVPPLQEAIKIQKKLLGKQHPQYAFNVNSLAVLYRSMGRFEEAEPLFREARSIQLHVRGKEHPEYAIASSNLAGIYKSLGEYSRADPLYREAKRIQEKTLGNEHGDYARTLNSLGGLCQTVGDYASATSLYLEAKSIYEKVVGKEHPDYAGCVNNLAGLYHSMGDYDRAEPLYREAKAIAEKVLGKGHPYYALSLNNLAGLYDSMGDNSRAESLYRESIAIAEKTLGTEHPEYASALLNLGLLYRSMGEYAKAVPLLKDAKAIEAKVLGKAHPHYAETLDSLAGAYQSMGENSLAEPLFNEAREIQSKVIGKEHPGYATTSSNLASLYVSTDRVDQAIPIFEESLLTIRKHLGQTAFVLSERQQLAMVRQYRRFLDNYCEACFRSGELPPQALEYVTQWKGSVLYRLRQMRRAAADTAISAEFIKLQQASIRLSNLAQAVPAANKIERWKNEISQLTAEKESLEAEMSKKSATYREAIEEVTFEQIRAAIPTNAVLVDYLEIGEGDKRKVAASIVRRDADPVMVALDSAKEADEAIDAWRESYGFSSRSKAAGQKLRRQIWEPLLEHVQEAETVLVSTDGALGRFPLAALPGKEAGKYLIEEHRLALIPVPRLLPMLLGEQRTQRPSHELLLIGDVDYGEATNRPEQSGEASVAVSTQTSGELPWPALKETGPEVGFIGRMYRQLFSPPGDAVIDLRGAAANESSFRELAPRSRFLHLATHGFFASADEKSAEAGYGPGQLSGLVFAGANRRFAAIESGDPGQTDDGIMTADEIAYLPLEGVQLAVLSACDTGLGEVAGGEGLLGIQRGFQVAGARTTVASLWKVNDAATRRIMQEFYTNLFQRKMSTLDALREAQLWALSHSDKEWGDALRAKAVSRPNAKIVDVKDSDQPNSRLSPQLWAPFVLSGDWR